MTKVWSSEDILALARSFQPVCVLVGAAELDLFDVVGAETLTAKRIAERTGADQRAIVVLLDALVSLELMVKENGAYGSAPGVQETLTTGGASSVLALVQHLGNCLRRWAHLGEVVKTGAPAPHMPSIRGGAADQAAFVGAMDNICASVADKVIEELGALTFNHLLDVGGALGTWTNAWLMRYPNARATLFDLPDVIPLARQHMEAVGIADRIDFAAGDFDCDALPTGADLAWVSAIIHQNSRQQNRRLFGSVHAALREGGQLLIRDVIMDQSRTRPAYGALFAVNMLVATDAGGTFTFDEMAEDLEASGFRSVEVLRQDEGMNAVVRALRA